jgi:putative tryptophan/tyrosine transport system substrate-binding protein
VGTLSRRAFVGGAGAVGGAVLVGCGPLPFQRPPPTAGKVYRLGFLSGSNPAATAQVLDIFRQALGELGYWEGQNLVIEYRWGEGNDLLLIEPAAALARLPVDGFVVSSTVVARIVGQATTTVPIVLAGTGDPVADGLAASYARPGGNVTGVTTLAPQLFGKRLQLLKEAVPSTARVAVFWDATSNNPYSAEAWDRAAQAVGVELHVMEPRGPEDLEAVFEHAARAGATALIRGRGPLANAHRARIIQLATQYRWPTMFDQRPFVEDGGLMAYAANLADLWRRAAVSVDKILKGARPTDVPIEQPMLFDFMVNLKTAQALGITFPNEIMLQVTEVVQ